jgi:hypothetical protein
MPYFQASRPRSQRQLLDAFYFHENVFRAPKAATSPKVPFIAIIMCSCSSLNLCDPPFFSQIRQYPHKSIIVNIDVIQYDRMVNLVEFLDEFLYGMLFSLVFSIQHNNNNTYA